MTSPKRLGTYKFSTMNLAVAGADRRVYRAGFRTLGNMMALSLIALFFAYGAHRWVRSLGNPRPSAKDGARREEPQRRLAAAEARMKETMSEEQWAKARKRLDEKRRRREREAVEKREKLLKPVRAVVFTLCGLAVFVAVMAPLGCLWGQVAVTITPNREIEVLERGIFFATRRRWPIDAFQAIQLSARGIQHGGRGGLVWGG